MNARWNRRTKWAAGMIAWGVVCLWTGICCIGPKNDPQPSRESSAPLGTSRPPGTQ